MSVSEMLELFTKGARVRVSRFKTLRTIFVNAEVSPGKTTWHDGYEGEISGVFAGETEATPMIEVKSWDDQRGDYGYRDHSLDELTLI